MNSSLSRLAALGLVLVLAASASAAHKWGLNEGTPDVKSATRLAFGPDGILFVGDPKGAAIFAIDTGDAKGEPAKAAYDVKDLTKVISAALNNASEVAVTDMAVNPLSGNVYLAVTVGAEKTPAIVKVDSTGKATEVSLKKIAFLKATLPNPPADKAPDPSAGPRAKNRRPEAITDLAYASGKVLVAGVTSETASSNVRELAFPFADADTGTQLEIYHAAHGKVEDYAAVRTFIPLTVDGKPSLLAGFTCTPLVRFTLDDLDAGKKVRGTTVAELGNRNTPIDMIAYEKDGERYLLMSNTARGVMKINTKDIGRAEGITAPVSGGGTAGQKFETIEALKGTTDLDKLNDKQAVVIVAGESGASLRSVDLP